MKFIVLEYKTTKELLNPKTKTFKNEICNFRIYFFHFHFKLTFH